MRKSPDPVFGIILGTFVMLCLAVPRTIADWDQLKEGSYSTLWFIWPMIAFGLVMIALAAWRTWGPRRIGKGITVAEEEPEEWPRSGPEDP
jgi:H+/Cl- antiporter ClcA